MYESIKENDIVASHLSIMNITQGVIKYNNEFLKIKLVSSKIFFKSSEKNIFLFFFNRWI